MVHKTFEEWIYLLDNLPDFIYYNYILMMYEMER